MLEYEIVDILFYSITLQIKNMYVWLYACMYVFMYDPIWGWDKHNKAPYLYPRIIPGTYWPQKHRWYLIYMYQGFWYFREIPRNSQKNTKYREICRKYFQIHVGKTYLILILAIRPVLFTPNIQIYLETSSLQRVNNVPKLPGVFRWTLRKTGH